MASYEITFTCGHVKEVRLSGPRRLREREVERMAGGTCGPCWRQETERARTEENERNANANRAAGLPALEGSPKQTPWAETIRASILRKLEAKESLLTKTARRRQSRDRHTVGAEELLVHVRTAHAALLEVSDAKWFIDHRNATVLSLALIAKRGRLRPRTKQDRATGFAPGGLNRLTIPAEEVAGRSRNGRHVFLRLVRSTWEGCWAVHPARLATQEPDGSLTIQLAGDSTVRISDGARTRQVPAADFYRDRVCRRTEPGERHYWDALPYRDDGWNSFDVPEGEVSGHQDKEDLVVVRLACSRWEGLHFHHPETMVRRHRPGFVTVRFPPGWDFALLGGERRLNVDGREMHQDRSTPLPEPGKSLAVQPRTWHTVTFHPSRLRRAKDAWMVRLPPGTPWPEATVFHPHRACRVREDGRVAWRFHQDWDFRVLTPDAGTVELDPARFLELTDAWAGTPPTPGVYVHEPDRLAPVGTVAVPAELLDDPESGDDT